MIHSKKLLTNIGTTQYTLTVVTNPASATCTLTYNGTTETSKTAIVPAGTIISYSVYHSTYGTETGSITMDGDKTLTCTGTYSTSETETSWSQPTLTANGTMGGSSFAVSAKNAGSALYKCEPWKTFASGTSTSNYTYWDSRSSSFPTWIAWYNPDKLKVSKLIVSTVSGNNTACGSVVVQGTNSYTTSTSSGWTDIKSYTNASNANFTITGVSPAQGYNYYRLLINSGYSSSATYVRIGRLTITATTTTTAYNYYWNKTIS